MTFREAKRQAWWRAMTILLDHPLPTSEQSNAGFAESEGSSANFARWQRAWYEVLDEISRRGCKGGG